MSFPVTIFPTILIVGDDDDLTNVILQASFDGRLKSNEKFLSATGDLATLTAASGKDLYLTAAQVTFYINDTNAISADEVVLDVNGTIVETSKAALHTTASSGGSTSTHTYNFENIGHKVAATQILKLEVIAINAKTDIEGFIQAIEVPTGENPSTYTGA